MGSSNANIYTKLAELYDTIMQDVDYESWADFIDEIMQTHHSNPVDVLEMGSGTGSISLSLAELECYNLTASDLSSEMIEVAQRKARELYYKINFRVNSFQNLDFDSQFDCIFSVFDSVNYLHNNEEILLFLENTQKALKNDGLLVFDFSTPKNSLEAVDHLNDVEGEKENLRYYRTSKYDPHSRFHTNSFVIEELDPKTKEVTNRFKEIHTQRAYSLSEMLSIVKQTSYHLVAKYDGFDLIDADDNSTRVTLVLRCQKTQ